MSLLTASHSGIRAGGSFGIQLDNSGFQPTKIRTFNRTVEYTVDGDIALCKISTKDYIYFGKETDFYQR
jgi:hypothetical protein